MKAWEEGTFSTQSMGTGNAQHNWSELLSSSMFAHMDVRTFSKNYHANLARAEFGPGNVYLADAPAQTIHHNRASLSAANNLESSFVIQVRQGALMVESSGRGVNIENGDCVLVDSQQAFTLSSTAPTLGLVIRLPNAWLMQWVPFAEDMVARRLSATEGWGKALASTLENIQPASVRDACVAPSTLAEHVASLLALSSNLELKRKPPSKSLLRMNEIRQALRDVFYDADITPADISAKIGISKRYLHLLLAENGTTFGHELIELRLEQAHKLLKNNYGKRSVIEIAMFCGFSDASHFSKRFKSKYGVSPSSIE